MCSLCLEHSSHPTLHLFPAHSSGLTLDIRNFGKPCLTPQSVFSALLLCSQGMSHFLTITYQLYHNCVMGGICHWPLSTVYSLRGFPYQSITCLGVRNHTLCFKGLKRSRAVEKWEWRKFSNGSLDGVMGWIVSPTKFIYTWNLTTWLYLEIESL